MAEPAVAYVISRWGEPTQTFVRREAEAVARAGCRVRVLSLKRPVAGTGTADVAWLGPAQVASGVFRALRAEPRATVRAIASVVRHSRPRNLPAQLVAALIGRAWAGRGLVDGVHLHAHFGWVAATAAWAASAGGERPFSVVLHAFELHDRRRLDRFTPVPLRAATQVFTISERDRGIVRERWEIEPEVVRMGVPRDWLAQVSEDRDPWLIVAVGSLLAKKGHGVLVSALARADDRWRLVIIGDGPLRDALQAQIHEAGVGARVALLGRQPEPVVRSWLDRAAVSCLASVETPDGDRDGIPVALMEAMARGAAVVTTDVGAIAELIEGVGLVVRSGDPVTLAHAIDRLRDPEERRRLADAARQRVESEFVADRAAAPIVDLVASKNVPSPVSA